MIHEDDACKCGCNDAPTQASQDVPSLERTVEGSSGDSPTGTPGRDMISDRRLNEGATGVLAVDGSELHTDPAVLENEPGSGGETNHTPAPSLSTDDHEDDPNTDLIGYVFKIDGGTGTVTRTTHWDPNYVSIWVIKRNIDWYCRACDLFSEHTDNCFMCGALLEMVEADPDERILGWETVRSAALVRRAKELRS